MSVNRQALLDQILNPEIPIQVYRAVVLSVQENRTCTVELLSSGMEVDQVRLVAEEDAGQWAFLTPLIGSIVLVGCTDNAVTDLFLVQYGEIDSGEILIGDTRIGFNKDSINIANSKTTIALNQNSASISQDTVKIELLGGKIDISNGSTSLKELFDDLGSLLTSFKVVTAQGPSTALFADTLVAVTDFKLKYPLLLK